MPPGDEPEPHGQATYCPLVERPLDNGNCVVENGCGARKRCLNAICRKAICCPFIFDVTSQLQTSVTSSENEWLRGNWL